MSSRFLVLCFSIILSISIVLPQNTFAVSSSSIDVRVAPENPSPGEDTTITLTSYASNLNSVIISWFVNGKKATSGIGIKSFTTKAPNAGSENTVRAVVNLPDGEIEKIITLRPGIMTLLWQAEDSYVPPFYKGKALPTIDSAIKVVAIPELRNKTGAINPKTMLYSWQRNYTNDAEGSGYGKNSFTYINDYLEDSDTIGVTASTVDGQYSSVANISIGTVQPKILFYKRDSVLGTLWERSLPRVHKINGEEVVVAEPYFLSPKEIQSPRLVWNWLINNTPVTISRGPKNVIPLRIESGTSGTSKLRLEIENKDQILERAEKEIDIEF